MDFSAFRKLQPDRGFKKVGNYRVSSQVIGSGSNGEVRSGVHIPTSMKVAVKVINIANPKVRDRAYNEVKAMKAVGSHPHIVKLFGTEEESNGFLYLFLELASGGDLFSYVQRTGALPEEKARDFLKQLISALSVCHSNSIIHRDVKLDNVLLTKENKLKLSDFGLSAFLPKAEPGSKPQVASCAGSPLYMAPEVFALQPHDEKIDVWSLGVCLYYMTVGSFPFVADSYNNLEECVLFEDVRFQPSMRLSAPLEDLITRMLDKNPNTRISLQSIRNHTWMVEDPNLNINATLNPTLNPTLNTAPTQTTPRTPK